LAGTWKLTRKIRGTQAENTVEAQWVLNHQFLQIHMKDVANPPAYEVLVLIGYAHADQKVRRPLVRHLRRQVLGGRLRV
jgi:hypothetical protein